MSKRLGKLSSDDLDKIETIEDAIRIIGLRCENRWHNENKKWIITEHRSEIVVLCEQVNEAKPELNIDPEELTDIIITWICSVKDLLKKETIVKLKSIENLTTKNFSSDPNLIPQPIITGEIDTNDIIYKVGMNFSSLTDEEKSIISNSRSIREFKSFCDRYNITNERLMAIENSTLKSLNINKNIDEVKYNCFYNTQKFMLCPHDIGNRRNLMTIGINGKGVREILITFIWFNIKISKHPEALDNLNNKYDLNLVGNELYKITNDMKIEIRNYIYGLDNEEPVSLLDELMGENNGN